MPVAEKIVYLTFDDGPVPEVTPWVLEQLKKYNAKATFFCIGDNIRKNPEIYKSLLTAGHQTGNHTFNHLNGWKVNTEDYLKNTALAADYIKSFLFRPPYGKIKFFQALRLKRQYKIVMWDVLSYDFDINTSPQQCMENVIVNAVPGSIVVFHDSIKAEKNLKFALPEVLKYFSERQYRFEIIR